MRSLNTIVVRTLMSMLLLALTGCHGSAPVREPPGQEAPAPKPGKPITSRTALIVRGMNATSCDASSIGAGSNPKVGNNSDVQNLSVSCSEDPKVTLPMLRRPLPQPHLCWAKLEELQARNSSITVVTDPLPNNPYHCLVSQITPNEMVKALHYAP